MLDELKALLNITSKNKDNLLLSLLNLSMTEAIEYTHNDDAQDLKPAILAMAMHKYRTLGSEGLSSESYSGVSFNYTNDYPENIIRLLKNKRKVIMR